MIKMEEDYECADCGKCWSGELEPDTDEDGAYICDMCEGNN